MILFVNACVHKESRTLELARYFLERHSDVIEEVNLNCIKPMSLDENLLSKRDSLTKRSLFDDEIFTLAKQFANADLIVVAAPYWDLSFPSLLKAYLENVTVCGVSFVYSESGMPKTLCKAKKLVYITTAGGKIISDDFGYGYVKALANTFYGVDEFQYIKAEGMDIYGNDPKQIIEDTKKEIDLLFV